MAELTDDQWNEFTESIGDSTAATKSLTAELRSGAKSAGDALGKLNTTSQSTSDTFEDMNDEVRDATDEIERMTEAADFVTDAWKHVVLVTSGLTTAFANTTKDILANGESFGVMRSFIDPLADGMGLAIKMVGQVSAGLVGLGGAIPVVGGGFTALAESIRGLSKIAAEVVTKLIKFGANLVIDGIEQLWSMFEGAASAGVLFTNGLTEMNAQRGAMSLTTQEYTEVIKNNRDQLSIFGGSVGEGAKRLAAVGKESKVFNEELRAMGITYKEQAENTSDFMASLQRSGQLRLLNDKQIATASAEYQRNLVVMSSLTGKSIETMKQERDEALKNMAFQAELAKMDPKLRAEMESALLNMPVGMKKAFQESVIFGKVMTDTGAIVSGASVYIEKYANSVRDGTATNEEGFQSFRDDLKANAPQLRKNLSDLAAAGMAELLGNGNVVTRSINDFSDSLYKEISRAENTAKETVAKMLTTGEQQEAKVLQILAGLDAQRAMQDKMLKLIEDEAMPIVTDMFKTISETMNEQLGKFVDWMKDPDEEAKKMTSIVPKGKGSLLGKDGVLDNILTALLDGPADMMSAIADWWEGPDVVKETKELVDARDDFFTDPNKENMAQIQAEMSGASVEENMTTSEMLAMHAIGKEGGLADRKIAELQAKLDALEARTDKYSTAEYVMSGFDSKEEDIADLVAGIKALVELQDINNEELARQRKATEAQTVVIKGAN